MLKTRHLSRQICACTNDFVTDSNDDLVGGVLGLVVYNM